ncbi:MAG: hypothetical protein H0T47_02445 [Planctomycetaceae bacterium]|nr:hypothetical protein [Planctomycetaceae bacterium]
MIPYDIPAIATALNERAQSRPIGRLQAIRKDMKHFSRRPGKTIFSGQTIREDWAFHHGGRAELQFNIGKDGGQYGGPRSIRYGVAFSFETSQTLPSLDVLKNKMPLFDDFLKLYADEYERVGISMWHHEKGMPPIEHRPGPIDRRLARDGVFAFLGKHQLADALDYEEILDTFDFLLPLYEYVESGGGLQPRIVTADAGFLFLAGCPPKPSKTKAFLANSELEVALRHNELQASLHDRLGEAAVGKSNVGVEIRSGCGTRIDVVTRNGDSYWFFEIKTAHSPRACIREAIGQLLEYSFWPGAQEAARLVIVGESPLDSEAEEYLNRLRERFDIPVYYEQLSLQGEATPVGVDQAVPDELNPSGTA